MIQWNLPYTVIDMHTHMGQEYCLYYGEHDADGMIRSMDRANVERIISAPCEDLFDGESCRAQITDAMARYPGRILGYYSVNPRLKVDVFSMERDFREHPGYVGLKFLPDYHRVPLSSDVYRPALEFADQRNLIVLCHTWGVSMNGESCNSADEVVKVLERYPNITFLMGHSIQGQVNLAIEIAATFQNAYLEVCDTCRLNGVVEKMVARAGAEKVVFGTDAPMQGFAFQLGAVIGARITPEQRKLILHDNAVRLLEKTGRMI